MTMRLSVLCALLLVFSAAGEQLKLRTLKVGSTTYSNVTIIGANVTDLYFSHSMGFANIKLKYAPAELQKRFGYDAKAAAEAERKQNEEDLLYESNLAQSVAAQRDKAAANKTALGAETGLADPVSSRSLLGKPGPKLEVDQWLGDKPTLDGKFLLLNFWAPWSVPCRQWVTQFNAIQKKFADKLTVVGVTTEPQSAVAELANPIEYASAIDAKAKLSAAAGVTSIPYVLLCDPKGIVLYQGHPGALSDKKLEAILARPSEP